MRKVVATITEGKLQLKSPFSPCPHCHGTTTMDAAMIRGQRRIFSICYSCESRWDLKGNPIHRGAIVRLPYVPEQSKI